MRAYSQVAAIAAAALAVTLYGGPSYADQRPEQQRQEQHGAPPRANQGRIPPTPRGRIDHAAPREPQRLPNGRIVETQHVDGDRWYGHDSPNDARFRLTRQFEAGRFNRVGPSYRYEVNRIDDRAHRFWIAGRGGFEVAAWDWPLVSAWCWTCGGDDFVIYDDPDHPGWYLVYNIHTDEYVHAQFLGA
jgi:hypothetical protein